MWIPRETVVGAVKSKTKLTGGMEGVGGKVVGKMEEARPSREGGVGTPRAHDIKGQFGEREKAVRGQQGNRGGWRQKWR